MNKKLMKASVAGAAAIALAAGGSTFAAFSDFGDINGNAAQAGVLKLDLAPGPNGNGSSSTTMDFTKLYPGQSKQRFVWLASENASSATPNANLSIQIHNLSDTAAACATSLGKAINDAGCTVDPNNNISGTPAANSYGTGNGHLSQVLTTYLEVFKNATAATCNAANWSMGSGTSLIDTSAGDLLSSTQGAIGAGHTTVVKDPTTNQPLVLHPGDGLCVSVSTYWDQNHPQNFGGVAAENALDNSAQGDAMSFDLHFVLAQV